MGRFSDEERKVLALAREEVRVLPVQQGQRLVALRQLFSLRRRLAYTARRRVLRALLPELRVRLRTERWLARTGELEGALRLVLEALPRAAWVFSKSGRCLFMNEPARLRPLPALDQPGDRTFERKPIAIGAILVLEAPAPVDSEDRVKAVAHSWGLSPRELQTLRHLVAGASNKQIASELGCAARTVEVHVARVLRRAGVANRTALVASFWGQQVHEEA